MKKFVRTKSRDADETFMAESETRPRRDPWQFET